ncbi:hypothetical protein EZS27_030241 [termite gut metagenome]|uniref:Uncharacterized protein n=1 Tax=termite gut metagenome TaxID=433724 RepID=A0A5J4QGI7_9ZZZZ
MQYNKIHVGSPDCSLVVRAILMLEVTNVVMGNPVTGPEAFMV